MNEIKNNPECPKCGNELESDEYVSECLEHAMHIVCDCGVNYTIKAEVKAVDWVSTPSL